MQSMKPNILFIVPADYDELREKGVEGLILERDENGFFGKVLTVHPVSRRTRSLTLNDQHEVRELGLDLIPGARSYKVLRVVQYPVQLIRVILEVVRLLKASRISLIRANDPFWMGFFALVGSYMTGIPYCVSIHADYDQRMRLDRTISMSTVFGSYKLAKLLSGYVMRRASMILPIRESLRPFVLRAGVDDSRIRVIPHGIDLDFFRQPVRGAARSRFSIADGKKIISFVGRLSRENYIYDVLEIARRLSARRSDFILVVAGGGKEESKVRALVGGDPELRRHVLLTGFQSQQVCRDLRVDSFVSLCLMAGYSLIEACAAGRPVVAYDVEWHHELVKNEFSGFLVAERNVAGAVDAIDRLMANGDRAMNMGENAKQLAFSKHDIAITSAIKVSCYREILAT